MSGLRLDRLKTLVVDDNEHMRQIMRTMLLALGVSRPRIAASGEEALRRIGEWDPDLVITDLQMVPMDGIALVRALRRQEQPKLARVGIILMTAHGDRDSICAARDAGVTEFLAKPVSVRSLADRIVQIVERPRAFVQTDTYVGPDRRRRTTPPSGTPQRRRDDPPVLRPAA
jgi:CheY-like chemotaxis protein